ncbi:hypothetical protein LCGC14_2334700, partial [marine sediment metagenome]
MSFRCRAGSVSGPRGELQIVTQASEDIPTDGGEGEVRAAQAGEAAGGSGPQSAAETAAADAPSSKGESGKRRSSLTLTAVLLVNTSLVAVLAALGIGLFVWGRP